MSGASSQNTGTKQMNAKDILKALQIQANKETTAYGSKLSKMLSFIRDIKKLPGFRYELGEITAIEITESQSWYDPRTGSDNRKVSRIHAKFDAQKLTLKHASGEYSIHIPVNNDFYNYVLFCLDIQPAEQKPEAEAIELPAEFRQAVAKALPYASKDSYRPQLMSVCLDVFETNKLRVVATNAHKLYLSNIFEFTGQLATGKYILPADKVADFLKLGRTQKSKSKAICSPVFLSIDGQKFTIGNIKGELVQENYPDYTKVIPEFKHRTVVNRSELITRVKMTLPFTNRTTNQVFFSLNGNIKIKGQDIDFSYESEQKMDYIESNSPDIDFRFNGKFLIDVLMSYPAIENVEICHIGTSERAFIIKPAAGSQEMSLLMPLMPNI